MALRRDRRWAARVAEVRTLLGRLRQARLREKPHGAAPAAGQTLDPGREVTRLLAELRRLARPLIAEAGHLSPRRVHFDPDPEEPASLQLRGDHSGDHLSWRMVFGPGALSPRGPGKTRRLVDGLRSDLALERAASRAHHVPPG